jgi:hypothetical protein
MKIQNSLTLGKQASLPSKILFFILLLSGLTCSDLYAQRGNNQIAIGAEMGPVISNAFLNYEYQIGLPIKAYLGTGTHGQWMVRSGLHHLWIPSRDLLDPLQSSTAYVVPLAFGYRRNINNWYAEGSIGIAWERSVLDYGTHDFGTFSSVAYPLNFGIEVGYQVQKFDFGVSLQNNLIRDRDDAIFTVLVGFKTMYRIGF